MPRIMGRVRIHGPRLPTPSKKTLCKDTQNTANRVEVQHFSDIKNYETIEFLMPRIMGRV